MGSVAFTRTLSRLQPLSLIALLATLILLFAFQGEVPVMLSVVKIVQMSRGWYESRHPDKAKSVEVRS